MGGSAIVVVIAAFLPWASLFGLSVSGINGDGKLTLVLALIGLAALAASRGIGPVAMERRAMHITELVAGALVAVIGLVDLRSISAIGLYLTLLAGVAWAGAAVVGLRGGDGRPV